MTKTEPEVLSDYWFARRAHDAFGPRSERSLREAAASALEWAADFVEPVPDAPWSAKRLRRKAAEVASETEPEVLSDAWFDMIAYQDMSHVAGDERYNRIREAVALALEWAGSMSLRGVSGVPTGDSLFDARLLGSQRALKAVAHHCRAKAAEVRGDA